MGTGVFLTRKMLPFKHEKRCLLNTKNAVERMTVEYEMKSAALWTSSTLINRNNEYRGGGMILDSNTRIGLFQQTSL